MQLSVSETVFNHIAEYFSVPANKISAASVAADLAGWDSMANAEIILGLEEILGCELEPEDLFNLNNVGSLIEVFEKKL